MDVDVKINDIFPSEYSDFLEFCTNTGNLHSRKIIAMNDSKT